MYLIYFQIYAHRSILYSLLKSNTDTLLNKFKTYNCSSDLIEIIMYFCYGNCLDKSKEYYLQNLIKNKDGLYNIIENIDELDGLKHLLEMFEMSFKFNQGSLVYI